MKLELEDGIYAEPEDEKLYRVVCGLYSEQMLGAVKGRKPLAIISLDPKDKDGNLIEDFGAYYHQRIWRN